MSGNLYVICDFWQYKFATFWKYSKVLEIHVEFI